MSEEDARDNRALAVLTGNAEVGAARTVRVIVDRDNELSLELLEADRLPDESALRNTEVTLAERNYALAASLKLSA